MHGCLFVTHSIVFGFWASIHDPADVEFGKAVMKNCGIKDHDLLIMDNNVSEDFLIQIRELGVAVETVGLEEV
ncbi:MAG: hypothetical protein HFG92_18210 [Dorea sp.]|jgi:hypothetical protein|nr:hypothetical protein [Dorea sp.]